MEEGIAEEMEMRGCLARWECEVVAFLPLTSSESPETEAFRPRDRKGLVISMEMSDRESAHLHPVPSEKNGSQRHFKSHSSDLSPGLGHVEQRSLFGKSS